MKELYSFATIGMVNEHTDVDEKKPVELLMQWILSGDADEVEKILKANPILVCLKKFPTEIFRRYYIPKVPLLCISNAIVYN